MSRSFKILWIVLLLTFIGLPWPAFSQVQIEETGKVVTIYVPDNIRALVHYGPGFNDTFDTGAGTNFHPAIFAFIVGCVIGTLANSRVSKPRSSK